MGEASQGGRLVIATFGPTTGWQGRTITYAGGVLALEGFGPITAEDVLRYSDRGHLVWAYDGLEEWIRGLVLARPSQFSPAEPARHEETVLVFDTETSDLPRNWRSSPMQVDDWPHLVQIAWIVCDLSFRPKRSCQRLIRPDGWVIAPGAAAVHGISMKQALKKGVPIAEVLPAFDAELAACGLVVAHNLEFDQSVMTAEFIRAGMPHHFDDVDGFCTMRSTTDLCRLTPMKYGEYKWPKLTELHEFCTGKPMKEAHDAMADAEAVVHCLRALRKAGAIKVSVSSSRSD